MQRILCFFSFYSVKKRESDPKSYERKSREWEHIFCHFFSHTFCPLEFPMQQIGVIQNLDFKD